jgi:hypothetical protein
MCRLSYPVSLEALLRLIACPPSGGFNSETAAYPGGFNSETAAYPGGAASGRNRRVSSEPFCELTQLVARVVTIARLRRFVPLSAPIINEFANRALVVHVLTLFVTFHGVTTKFDLDQRLIRRSQP